MTLHEFVMETLKEVLKEETGSSFSKHAEKCSCRCNTTPKPSGSRKRVITETFILGELAAGREIVINSNDIVTPLAKDVLRSHGIKAGY